MKISLEITPNKAEKLQFISSICEIFIAYLPGMQAKTILEAARKIKILGYEPVPHLPVRTMQNEQVLVNYLDGCRQIGIKKILVISGESKVVGVYSSCLQVLQANLLYGFEIGIAGYPEIPESISTEIFAAQTLQKQKYADFIVSQYCASTAVLVKYLHKSSLPVRVGVLGPCSYSSLLAFSKIVGVKVSNKELKNICAEEGIDYDPSAIVSALRPHISHLHVYSYGGVKKSMQWIKNISNC